MPTTTPEYLSNALEQLLLQLKPWLESATPEHQQRLLVGLVSDAESLWHRYHLPGTLADALAAEHAEWAKVREQADKELRGGDGETRGGGDTFTPSPTLPIAPSSELKPCPFCGAPGYLHFDTDFDGWIVECSNRLTLCDVAPSTDEQDCQADAIAAWNRRAS